MKQSINIKIQENEILINSAWVSLETPSLIIIDIDCKSKYAQVCGYSEVEFALCADEHTLYKGTDPRPSIVEIELPEHFAIDTVRAGRYDVRVYCVNKQLINDQAKMIWETGRK